MAITREFPWQYQGICFGKTRDFYLTEYNNVRKPLSASRLSSELAQNERLYNVEATNNIYAGGKRVRGFIGIEVLAKTPLLKW